MKGQHLRAVDHMVQPLPAALPARVSRASCPSAESRAKPTTRAAKTPTATAGEGRSVAIMTTPVKVNTALIMVM